MAVPRNRHSNARKNNKRSHHAKVAAQAMSCPNCKAPKLAHRMCMSCGHYNGRAVYSGKEASQES